MNEKEPTPVNGAGPTQERAPELAPGDEAPPEEPSSAENVCPECGGSGEAGGGECANCGGSGRINEAIGGG